MRASQIFSDWSVNPAALAGLLVAAGAYGAGVRRAAPRWPRRRSAAFGAGIGVLVVASQSGIDGWSERLLSVHMVAHLLIIAVGAPLLVAGAPVSLALRTLPRGGREGLLRLLRTRAVGVLVHPATALSLFTGVVLATHLPAVYDAALGDPALHGAEHALYLWSALVFWAPVVGVDPLPHRLAPVGVIGYLLAAMIPMSVVGAALSSSDTVAYAPYLTAAGREGISALADQRSAGTIMWLGGTLVLVGATLAAAWAGMVREERRARAREEQADRRGQALGVAP